MLARLGFGSGGLAVWSRRAPEPSVVGPGLCVEGLVEAPGEVRVFGTVQGDVRAASVHVARDGAIEGDVHAGEVWIEGTVRGRIFAESITLAASAAVEGILFHHRLSVAEGALVEGRMPWRPRSYFRPSSFKAQAG